MGCNLCPRACNVSRKGDDLGWCKSPWDITAARAALHMWEEPVISGTCGSGTVFFSGCNLGCVFCQNRTIAKADRAKVISRDRLAEIFLMLQEQGAHNINLVTGSHYIPQIASALEKAKKEGLYIPVVYNTGGYDKVETLRMLEGLVDVWLPDLKYYDPDLSARYANAPDYFEVACKAIDEMVRQAGKTVFVKAAEDSQYQKSLKLRRMYQGPAALPDPVYDEGDEEEPLLLARKGVIVRHLLLPGQLKDSMKILGYLHEKYQDKIWVSIMNQYTPTGDLSAFPELTGRVLEADYDALVDYAIELGMEQAFIQDGETAEESFIPAFDYEGL